MSNVVSLKCFMAIVSPLHHNKVKSLRARDLRAKESQSVFAQRLLQRHKSPLRNDEMFLFPDVAQLFFHRHVQRLGAEFAKGEARTP